MKTSYKGNNLIKIEILIKNMSFIIKRKMEIQVNNLIKIEILIKNISFIIKRKMEIL